MRHLHLFFETVVYMSNAACKIWKKGKCLKKPAKKPKSKWGQL